MASNVFDPHDPLVRKLASLNRLDSDDLSAIRLLPLREQWLRAGSVVVSDDEVISECCLLISGFACRYKIAKNGSRQIVSFHVAGDILGIQHLLLERSDHYIQVISDAVVGYVSMSKLRQLTRERPEIGTALWRDCLVDASVYREWVLNVGRRDAAHRVAHMLCEFVTRCEAAGLRDAPTMAIPMTQEYIADATGLTPVHVNRVIRKLREDGFIERAGKTFRIKSRDALERFASFNPAYLHLPAESVPETAPSGRVIAEKHQKRVLHVDPLTGGVAGQW